MSVSEFDLAEYVRTPVDLRPENLGFTADGEPDWAGEIGAYDPEATAALLHLIEVESGSLDLMRDVFVTPAHREPDVTEFLVTWGYEQYWLRETLTTVAARGETAQTKPRPAVIGGLRHAWDERTRPIINSVRTNLLGTPMVASHMVTGWLNAAAIALIYQRLAILVPPLAELAERVADMKQRHLDFYAWQLHQRAKVKGARRYVRSAARKWRWPTTRYEGHANVKAVVEFLFADPACAPQIRQIDERLTALAGVGVLKPTRRALGRFVRAGHESRRVRVELPECRTQ